MNVYSEPLAAPAQSETGRCCSLQTPHRPEYSVPKHVELAVILRRRQVGCIERHGRAMQEHLAPEPAQTDADRTVDRYGLVPRLRIVIANAPPHLVGVQRAADAAALGRQRIAVPLEPAQAILPRHARLISGQRLACQSSN